MPEVTGSKSPNPDGGPLDGFLAPAHLWSVSRAACVREALNQVRLAQSGDGNSTHLEMAEAALRDELARIEEHAPIATPADKVATVFITVNGEALNFLEIQNATGLSDVALHAALGDLVRDESLRAVDAGDGILYWQVNR